MSSSALEVDGRRWQLVPTAIGPELATEEGPLEAFVTVVNSAVRFDVDGLLEALHAGAGFAGSGLSVEPRDHRLQFDVEHLPTGSTVDVGVVRDLLTQLEELRDETGAAPPWLFRKDTIWPSAHPSERQHLADLDEGAGTCDREPDSPRSIELRRSVLVAMDSSGLLNSIASGAKLQRLLRWRFDNLAMWYEAALSAERYLMSEGRRRYVPAAAPEPVLGSPVCIDLFRGGLVVPPSVDPDEWASWGETLLATGAGEGDEGTFLHHDVDGWVTVSWRKDVQHRAALLGLALGRPDNF
jgi:hypothetical protein